MNVLPPFIPISVIEELYTQGAEDPNMTLHVMAKYLGKFVEELEEEVWTDETLDVLEGTQLRMRADLSNIEQKDNGAWMLTLQHSVGGVEQWVFLPPSIGMTLKDPPLPTGNPSLDDFNFQVMLISRLANKSYEQVRGMAACDFNASGVILGNFPALQRLQKLGLGL